MIDFSARIAPNWTSAAGALEGILAFLGSSLPRHAVMGLTGHAWRLCLATRGGVTALPSGPADFDREAMAARYARTGVAWERFAAQIRPGTEPGPSRAQAVAFARAHLDAGRPLLGWDFHLHEHAVVYGYDAEREGFLVDDVITPEVGPFLPWSDWPSEIGTIELLAPVATLDADPVETVSAAIRGALDAFAGLDGAPGQPRGTAALDAWAEAFDGEVEVDRAGNAYTLAVLQAARLDGAAFLADLVEAFPSLAGPLEQARASVSEQTRALSPLLTLFPFPTGGHGNVSNPGLRRAAAMALRRAATHERAAAAALGTALAALGDPPARNEEPAGEISGLDTRDQEVGTQD